MAIRQGSRRRLRARGSGGARKSYGRCDRVRPIAASGSIPCARRSATARAPAKPVSASTVNRAGLPGGHLVEAIRFGSGGPGLRLGQGMMARFGFCGRSIADGVERSAVVQPVDPFEGVANSTAPQERHGPRRWTTPALSRSLMVSAGTLRSRSPTLPTAGSTPASARRSVQRSARCCPASSGRHGPNDARGHVPGQGGARAGP